MTENPVGHPPIYKTPEELQKKIEEYFDGGYRTRQIRVGNAKKGYEMIEVPVITISDLVIFLGFADRRSFYDYEERKEFSYTIKRARAFIEREYEEQLSLGNPTGAIFALKNFGWTDKQELEHSGRAGGPIETINLSKQDYINIRKEMIEKDNI